MELTEKSKITTTIGTIISLIVGAIAIVGVYYTNKQDISHMQGRIFVIEAAIDSANFKSIAQDLTVLKTDIARIKETMMKK